MAIVEPTYIYIYVINGFLTQIEREVKVDFAIG